MNQVSIQRVNLDEDGYFCFPRVLDDLRIKRLREVCDEYYSREREQIMPAAAFLAIPELAAIPFQPSVVSVLKSVLGEDYVTVPEFTMQTNRFGGWHTDAQTENHAAYLYRPDYLQIQCGIYLQDNSRQYGGGLDVISRSHLDLFQFGSPGSMIRRTTRRASYLFQKPVSIPSKSGDLVGFHFRTFHRATQHALALQSPKYAIFWVASINAQIANRYMNHLRNRARSMQVYQSILDIKFPDSYPSHVVDLVTKQQLRVATA